MVDVKYHHISATDEEVSDLDSTAVSPECRRRWYRSPILRMFLVFSCGFMLSTLTSTFAPRMWKDELDFLRPLGDQKVQFEYNATFSGPPTVESDLEWLELFPDGLGRIQDDRIGDSIYALAVFHQLHCVMVLRHAVYDQWNGTRHVHMGAKHVRHCLEYLRQAIVCNADTNMEVQVVGEDGFRNVPGWDVHRCRNYDRIREWSEYWKAFTGKVPHKTARVSEDDEQALHGRVIVY